MSTPGIDDLERLRAGRDDRLSMTSLLTAQEALWPDPLPLDDTAVPPFPVGALPPILSDFVVDVARVRQVPPDLPAMLALAVVSASVARRAIVRVGESHTEPLNAYVAVVAASGERKTPPFRDCLEPVYRAQRELQRAAEHAHRAAAERRAAQMKRLEHLRTQAARENDPSERERIIGEAEQLARDLPPEPVLPRFVVDDRTAERLEVDLAEQGGALLLASEEAGTLFAVAAGRYARDGGDQAETLLKAYDGGRIDTQPHHARSGRLRRPGPLHLRYATADHPRTTARAPSPSPSRPHPAVSLGHPGHARRRTLVRCHVEARSHRTQRLRRPCHTVARAAPSTRSRGTPHVGSS